jgi:hypothetical protein
MTQLEARRINNIAFLKTSVGSRFKSWWAHAVEFFLLGTSFLSTPSVTFAMTTDAKRNQVVDHIAAEPTPGFHVMDLQTFHGTALLTPPAGWRQMSLKLSKLISSTEQGKEDSTDPPDPKQFLVEAISKEILRLAKLHDTAAAAEALKHEHNLAAARVPSQEVSDRLIRYEAHLSREFDRTLAQLERRQRMRLGQPVLPKL